MNDKIEELKKQCYISVADRNGDNEYDMEKFAELIIRECADVAADHDALDIYEEIREHFGIEE